MAQKKRISDEAFPWVKDTAGGAKQEAKSGTAKKSTPAAKKSVKPATDAVSKTFAAKPATKSTAVSDKSDVKAAIAASSVKTAGQALKRDTVFVLFDKKGTILSIAKMDRKYLPASGMPFVTTGDTQAAELDVPEELTEKTIAELHSLCLVRDVGSKPCLARK